MIMGGKKKTTPCGIECGGGALGGEIDADAQRFKDIGPAGF